MNYLAHLYLSGENEKVIVGNFIGDYVKGNKFLQFPGAIRNGIIMHRYIDTFTDKHPCVREAKQPLLQDYGLYAGIVIDLFYDHFLALNWRNYSHLSLREFSKYVHAVLLSHFVYLPARVQNFLPSLIQHRRLESYARKEGIFKSLELMSRYTSLPANSKAAMRILQTNYSFYEDNFSRFMQEIIDYVADEFKTEIKKPG